MFRPFSGSWADRTGRYWTLTLAGYALTAVCVPALAVTPFLAGAGLATGLRPDPGRAHRQGGPQLLPRAPCSAYAAAPVGFGRGFAVHKALDQAGAVLGPLLVAGVAALTGALWPALAVLVAPGAAALVVLLPPPPSGRRSGRRPRGPARAGAGTGQGWPAAAVVLAVRRLRRGRDRGTGHLRRDLLPPDPGRAWCRWRPSRSSTPPRWAPRHWRRWPPAGSTTGVRGRVLLVLPLLVAAGAAARLHRLPGARPGRGAAVGRGGRRPGLDRQGAGGRPGARRRGAPPRTGSSPPSRAGPRSRAGRWPGCCTNAHCPPWSPW